MNATVTLFLFNLTLGKKYFTLGQGDPARPFSDQRCPDSHMVECGRLELARSDWVNPW